MRRALAVCIALLLVIAVLAPGALAERGGRGGGEDNGNGQVAPTGGPNGDQDQDRDQDCEDCVGPIQDRKQDGKDVAGAGSEVTGEETKGPQGNGKGPDGTKPDNGKGPDGDKPDNGKGPDGDKPENGKGPENAPGQAVSAEVHSRFTNEGESTENTHRVQIKLQVEAPEEQDTEGDDDLDDELVDDDEPTNWAQRMWAWQRALQNSTAHALKMNNGAKPFMMVGLPTIGTDGSLAIDLWKGNRLARDYYTNEGTPTPISVTLASKVRLIVDGVVTECDPADTETCLADWLEANPDAYLSVWGRVVIVDGQEVFVASRITVTVPQMDGVTPEETPTEDQTVTAPTATPTATETPTEEKTINAPTSTPTP